MKNLFYLLLCLIAGASCSQADPTKPWDKGAFEIPESLCRDGL